MRHMLPMLRESVAILVIGVLLVVVLARAKYYSYAIGITPMLVLPTLHLIVIGILYLTKGVFFGIRQQVVIGFVDLLAVVATGVLIMVFSPRIETKSNRRLYQIMMSVYTVLLGWAFIYNTLQPLF